MEGSGDPLEDSDGPMVDSENMVDAPEAAVGSNTQDELVRTPVLDQYGLIFNTTYKLLICELCSEGVAFHSLHTHLKLERGKRLNWNEKRQCYALSYVSFEHHRPAKVPKRKNELQTKIVDSLISTGHIHDASEIRSGNKPDIWNSIPLPQPVNGFIPRVAGLRSFSDATRCTVVEKGKMCGYISPAEESLRVHQWNVHGRRYPENVDQVVAQTLTESGNGFFRYFSVSPEDPQSALNATRKPVNLRRLDLNAARRLLQKTTAAYTNDLNIIGDLNVKTTLPVFVITGIDNFLKPFNRTSIRQKYAQDRDHPRYIALHNILYKSFKDEMQHLFDHTLPSHIFLHLTNCTPNAPRIKMRREFSPLTEKNSIAAYGLVELRFIWAILKANERPGEKAYTFSARQKTALNNLAANLDKQNNNNTENTMQALHQVFDEVYFPENYAAKSDFDMPSSVFLAMQCVAENGSYTNIHLIPPIIAKLQYSFRLRSLRRIQLLRDEYPQNDKFWLEFVSFCERHLQDHNLSPFAILRNFLHKTSVVSKATPRPDMVWWRNDTVMVGEMSVNIAEYKVFLKKKLEETEAFIEQNILLGLFTLQELDKCCKISELKDLSEKEDVPANGVLLDIRDSNFDNAESDIFFLKMLQEKKLDIQEDASGVLGFGRIPGAKWISDIDKALSDVQVLSHITQGPGVGRMTEQALQSPINTMETSRNVVIDDKERTGGFRAGYHKGAFITGNHKEIFRLLPYRVFRLLLILIRIIRPIELAVLFDLLIKPENRQATVIAYRERIWASYGRAWTPAHLSENLQQFMQLGMGVKMGARVYRHFAIAIQRHYPDTNYGRYRTDSERESDREAQIHAVAADFMAGHIPDVADMIYARTRDILTRPVLKAAYVRVSKDWHKFLGFSTGPDDSN
ncbi:hypothetical protein HYPSUDRAFT_210138 [Hypholoma sublateritium FD-334 SS-4]|uniref:Uncharacterized protein n=1 Tax=Hypholoma sublateritium (strain FD-334 SS-4) TaxID=945553 RepID=A0A0D2NW39_HYPSF|nr:hypothetical protein HYPSUDRAFT_210138 [Hypholoma sublateritium FD-334 SS-4]